VNIFVSFLMALYDNHFCDELELEQQENYLGQLIIH